MTSKLDFPLHGPSVNIVTEFGAALSDIIHSKFGCVATFDGVDFEAGGSTAQRRKSTPIAPEKRCEFILPGGVKVSVWKADLTSFPADAVVNAANKRLQHYGGLAQALSDAGGPQIQQESDDYIKKHGPLNTGDAIVLGAGNLPYKMIIHAVGPDLPMHPSIHEVHKANPLLQRAIWNIFDQASNCPLTNVAIPAISSGLFHYPLPECADTIVLMVKHVYENYPPQRNLPKKVFFVNHDEPTVKEMEQACHRIFDPKQAVVFTQPATHTQAQTYSQAVTYTQAPMHSQGASNTKSSSKTSPPVQIQIENVRLTLKKDRIEEQKTDVIVNTASPCGNLSIGQISTAILQKAGREMQKEINNSEKKSHIIRTKSYKLHCKEVYHTFCIGNRSDTAAAAQQVLFSSVMECLQTAEARNHKSISFPAIGTGALGFRKTESAFIMLDAVVQFAQKFQKKLEVFFIIYPHDHETFQAFESQIRQHHQRVSHHSSPPVHNFQGLEGPTTQNYQRASHHSSTPASVKASKPQISLCGPSEESTRETEKWLSGLFNNTPRPVEIFNNFLLHFSDQDHQKLSLLLEKGVQIEEFLTQGHAGITIDGKSREDVVLAALKVEKMLCEAQEEFVSEEKHELQLLSDKKASFERQTDDLSDSRFLQYKRAFKAQGLWVTKVDRVKNPALEVLFDLKKQQLGCSSTKKMFQRIPAQFCEMISHIGFHAECAPPEDPKYGEGIYFADTVEKAMDLWKEKHEEFLYFVLADVLTGKSVCGKRGLIMPPVRESPDVLYDSVTGGHMSDVSVIFSGYQALPKYIFICRRNFSVL